MSNVATALLSLLFYDIVFLLVLLAIVALLSGTKRAAFAVMKRNFVGYFSNPTGYVFLCIFVTLIYKYISCSSMEGMLCQ